MPQAQPPHQTHNGAEPGFSPGLTQGRDEGERDSPREPRQIGTRCCLDERAGAAYESSEEDSSPRGPIEHERD